MTVVEGIDRGLWKVLMGAVEGTDGGCGRH